MTWMKNEKSQVLKFKDKIKRFTNDTCNSWTKSRLTQPPGGLPPAGTAFATCTWEDHPGTSHPTPPFGEHRGHDGGTLRVFNQFLGLKAGSVKAALSRPTHASRRVPLSPYWDLRQGATQSPKGDDVASR